MNGIAVACKDSYKNVAVISVFMPIGHRALFLLKTMDCCVIACTIVFVLIVAAVLIFVKRDGINSYFDRSDDATMVGGAKRKTGKRSNNGRGKNKTKVIIKRTAFMKRQSALTNVHNNESAKYIFIYFGDIYPGGLKESSMFKSLMNQTRYKNEAYGVYERPLNGQWIDNLMIDDAWEDFEKKLTETYKQEIMNNAKLVLIGKGYGAFYAKIFKYKLQSVNLGFHKAIALNGLHLREFMSAIIMKKAGLSEINLSDITFRDRECVYEGKDYVKETNLSLALYILMKVCDGVSTVDYFSFYGADGIGEVDIEPFNDVYDNTFLVRYGKKFVPEDWLKRSPMIEEAIKRAI